MNYKDNKDNTEQDDKKIKSHLKNSLDLESITVSEDLINRTLEAIKKQSTETDDSKTLSEEKSPKIIPWGRYVRGFAGVAAAILIVVVGYNVMLLDTGKKSESNTAAPNSTSYDAAQNSSAENANLFAAEEAQKDNAVTAPTEDNNTLSANETEKSTEYTITAKSSAADNGTNDTGEANSKESEAAPSSNNTTEATDTAAGSTGSDAGVEITPSTKIASMAKSLNQAADLTFREIFLSDPEQAEYVTISDDVNKTSITLTERAAILDFYSVMDNYTFTYSTDQSAAQNYTVEVKSPTPSETIYTLLVGNNLIVRCTIGDSVSETVYQALDETKFKQDLAAFYQKYQQ